MKILLSITPQSYLLTGSGEGSALIDSDVVFHKETGFPFIPARRIKGLLKESMEEVLEMQGEDDKEIDQNIEFFFGKEGKKYGTGMLRFGNAYLNQWDKLKEELAQVKKVYPAAFESNNIKNYYTTEIQQTALEDGIAKKRSLRNYRVLLPAEENDGERWFQTEITLTKKLTPKQKILLRRTARNLRYAGTRRNRGFGKVTCELTIGDDVVLQEGEKEGAYQPTVIPLKVDGSALKVSITTKSPVVLARLLGDQNTVFTERQISGNRLRGLFAIEYIRRKSKWENAHLDQTFRKLFLSGKVQYHNCLPEDDGIIPQNIHAYKGKKGKCDQQDENGQWTDNLPIDVFRKENDETKNKDDITKAFGGVGQYKHGKLKKAKINTTFFFHNSRNDRSAGRSTDSGIFYYEAIDEGHKFSGWITGPKENLQELADSFGASFDARIGRSRSAQYGEIAVALTSSELPGKLQSGANPHYLIALSPMILLNKWGHPEPCEEWLRQYLCEANCNVEPNKRDESDEVKFGIQHAAGRITHIEQYNSTWQSKSGKVPAYQAGSVFSIRFADGADLSGLVENGIGEWREQGFGQVELIAQDEFRKEYELSDEDNMGNDNGHDDPDTEIPSLLKPIWEKYKTKSEKIEVRAIAARHAEKCSKKLTGHLISRMEAMLVRYNKPGEVEDVKKWMKEVEDKPAGDKLKSANLMDDLIAYRIPGKEIKEPTYINLYWVTFFQTLRKLNKKE